VRDVSVALGPLDSLAALGGRAFVLELIESFGRDAPLRIRAAKEALDRGDLLHVQHIAHALKGGAGQLGARTLAGLAAEIEARAEAGDQEATAPLVGHLESQYEGARRELQAWCDATAVPKG
jgi:HPt (histidine-containing phosphotransfer) domain-containing protein